MGCVFVLRRFTNRPRSQISTSTPLTQCRPCFDRRAVVDAIEDVDEVMLVLANEEESRHKTSYNWIECLTYDITEIHLA
jgi:hypothetical protein